jgi:hypothetical protein
MQLASIFTSNSKTKAAVASELKNVPAIRQTKPIETVPSALLLPLEARSVLEESLKIMPAKQRRFENSIEDQSVYYVTTVAIAVFSSTYRLRS